MSYLCSRFPINYYPLSIIISKTAHGSVMQHDEYWYLACHYDVFPDGSYRRTTCIEYLQFNEDGTIKPVTITRKGGNPIIPDKWSGFTTDKPDRLE